MNIKPIKYTGVYVYKGKAHGAISYMCGYTDANEETAHKLAAACIQCCHNSVHNMLDLQTKLDALDFVHCF